jgi:hypothetical protein
MFMERLLALWNYAPLLGAIIVVAVAAFIIVRLVRQRRSAQAKLAPEWEPPVEINDDLLDSSHIGFAPLVGPVTLPPRREGGKNGS